MADPEVLPESWSEMNRAERQMKELDVGAYMCCKFHHGDDYQTGLWVAGSKSEASQDPMKHP